VAENIKVRNFLVLKKADVEIKRINVIIGPQANGKSLIAKLVYFFQGVSKEFLEGIRNQNTKRELDKKVLSGFESRFPKYSWEGTAFEISYEISGVRITILGVKGSRGKTTLSLAYSDELVKFYASKKRLYKRKLEEGKGEETNRNGYMSLDRKVMDEYIIKSLPDEAFYPFFGNSFFIPASRSFFANLQKNIFTFLASNLDIDPFLKEFGSLYERSKRLYKEDYFLRLHKKLLNELYGITEAIVDGEYESKDDQDWIVSKGRRVNLSNASSGQQESLPMLLVLCVWPMIRRDDFGQMFFIEEPEAHLFPNSQGHIISLLSMLYGKMGSSFFITSHSPYILSALNNFILAADSVAAGKITEEKFTKLNGSGMPIKFEDISAYTIVNGGTESISDSEYRMIGADLLDGISEHFEDVMNELLVCEGES